MVVESAAIVMDAGDEIAGSMEVVRDAGEEVAGPRRVLKDAAGVVPNVIDGQTEAVIVEI
jgi:hypothetical protein